MINVLTTTEGRSLKKHETTIEKGLATFYEVGSALLAIRDARLYRQSYGTFEDYCRERWDIAKSQAYRLIEATEVRNALSPIGDILPANEAQARPLASVPEEDRADVWQEVVKTAPKDDGGKPIITAKHVQSVIDDEYEGAAAKERQGTRTKG